MPSNYDPAEVQRVIEKAESHPIVQYDPTVRELLSALKSAQREIEVLKLTHDSMANSICPPGMRECDRVEHANCDICWRTWAESEIDKKGQKQ